MKVQITDPTQDSLYKIYRLYPIEVAERIIGKILERSETLSQLANRGRIVDELRSMNERHRYIIEGNFKIIYKQIQAKFEYSLCYRCF